MATSLDPHPLPPLTIREPAPEARSTARGRAGGLAALKPFLVGALFGGAAVAALAGTADPLDEPLRGVGPGAIAGALAIAVGLSLLVHELGHLAGGRLAGWRFALLALGPLRAVRVGDRVDVRLHAAFALYGGMALAVPRRWEGERAFRRANILMVVGGPAASLLLGAGAAGLRFAERPTWADGGFATLVLALTALLSTLIGVMTLVPMSAGGELRSDGAQLLELARHDRGSRGAFVLRVARILSVAQRPRDWPPEVVDGLLAARELPPAERAGALLLAAWAAEDRGALAAARDRLDAALAAVDEVPAGPGRDSLAGAFAVEAARFEALWRGDALRARRWLDDAHRGVEENPIAAALARAGIARAEGDDAAEAAATRDAARLCREAPLPIGADVYAPAFEALGVGVTVRPLRG